MFGKIGAVLVGAAPFLFAVEMSSINALIAAIPPTLAVMVGVIALLRGQKTLQVNLDGRMTQLLAATEKLSKAEGKEEERVEARDRREEVKHEIASAKATDKPQDVIVKNPPEAAANVKVGNLPTESLPVTLTPQQEKKQEKITEAQTALDEEIGK